MKNIGIAALFIAGFGVVAASPAAARVQEASERGIVMRYVAHVPVAPEQAWALLVKPVQWWDSEHTYSGDSANLTLDARPGGCFCEVLPDKDALKAAPRGGVEHMRVIYTDSGRALRLSGALGPLQADAAVGTLTFQFKPDGTGTQVLVEYVVGGFFRGDVVKLAPTLDKVIGAQVGRFVERLGGTSAAAFRPEGAPRTSPDSTAPGAEAVSLPVSDTARVIGR